MEDSDYSLEDVYPNADLDNIKIVIEELDEQVPTEDTIEDVVDQIVEEVPTDTIAEVVDQIIEDVVDQVVEEVPTDTIEEVVDQVVDQVVEEVPTDTIVEVVDQIVDQVVEEVQTDTIEEVVDQVVDQVVEEVQTDTIEEVVDQVVEEVQRDTIEEVVDQVVDQVFDQVVEEVPTDNISLVASSVPSIVVIVPYRDRDQQQQFFANHMKNIMEDYNYRILYIHQKDTRSFNRGAMKNIGFLYVKQMYPDNYKNITLVFNDVDTLPMTKGFLNYETTFGNVKHFYGYNYTLGGIVSIKAADFEAINGFPNYWAWGFEDNVFQQRVSLANFTIDRSNFYPIMDKNIIQLQDKIERIVNRQEFDKYINELKYKENNDGFRTISNIIFSYDENISFLNVFNFNTPIPENPELNQNYDLRNGARPFKLNPKQNRRGGGIIKMGGIQ